MPISQDKWKEFQKGFQEATGYKKPKEEEEKKRGQASQEIYKKVNVADALRRKARPQSY